MDSIYLVVWIWIRIHCENAEPEPDPGVKTPLKMRKKFNVKISKSVFFKIYSFFKVKNTNLMTVLNYIHLMYKKTNNFKFGYKKKSASESGLKEF